MRGCEEKEGRDTAFQRRTMGGREGEVRQRNAGLLSVSSLGVGGMGFAGRAGHTGGSFLCVFTSCIRVSIEEGA